jgi:hypothetical protein
VFEVLTDTLFIDFMTGVLDPRIALTRTAAAYYRGADGLLHQAAINQARLDYGYELDQPASSKGLLLEGSVAQLAQHTNDFTQAAWTKTNITAALDQVGPDGVTNSASSLLASAADGFAEQILTAVSGAHSFSPYIKRLVGSGTVEISIDGGATYVTATLTSQWKRFTVSQTLANPALRIRVRTSADKIAVWCAGCEGRARASSPIPRGSAAFTRTGDVASITGVDFSDFYEVGRGTLYAQFDQPVTNHNTSKAVLSISDGTAANDVIFFNDGSSGTPRLQMHTAGSTVVNLIGPAPVPGIPQRYIEAWDDSPFRVAGAINGVSVGSDVVGTVPLTIDRMHFGTTGALGSAGYCYLQQVQFWPYALTDAAAVLRTLPSLVPPAGGNLVLTTTAPIVSLSLKRTITPAAANLSLSSMAPVLFSAVMSYVASASSPTDNGAATEPGTISVTPPGGMAVGDLVLLIGQVRSTNTTPIALNATGGQAWSKAERAIAANAQSMVFYYCQFNGTWSADPSMDFVEVGGVQPATVIMHVFRGPTGRSWVRNEALDSSAQANAVAPYTITVPPASPIGVNPTLRIAGWMTSLARTFSGLAGTGWVTTGAGQYRNTGAGTGQSASFAHLIESVPAPPSFIANDQARIGDISAEGFTFLETIYESRMVAPGDNAATSPPNSAFLHAFFSDLLAEIGDVPLCLDYEAWLLTTDINSPSGVSSTVVGWYVTLLNIAKTYFSNVGMYGEVPERATIYLNYPVGHATYTLRRNNWFARNALMQPIWDAADVIYPSFYYIAPIHADAAKFDLWMADNRLLCDTHAPGKKVYPFLWPRIHNSVDPLMPYINGDYYAHSLDKMYELFHGYTLWLFSTDVHPETVSPVPLWWTRTLERHTTWGLIGGGGGGADAPSKNANASYSGIGWSLALSTPPNNKLIIVPGAQRIISGTAPVRTP